MPIKGFPPSHKAATDKGRVMGGRLRSAGYAVTSWEAGKNLSSKRFFLLPQGSHINLYREQSLFCKGGVFKPLSLPRNRFY